MSDDISTDQTRSSRTPWNKGKLTGPKPPLKVREIRAIRIRLQLANKLRDLALFNLAIDSKLRGCDLVALHVRDVAHGGTVAHRAIVLQHKTQQPVQFELTDQTRESVAAWIAHAKLRSEGFLFPSRGHQLPHLTTRQYARLVNRWVAMVGLDPADYGTHTLRRTKNLRAVQLLRGHRKLESTVRYLGVEVEDALEISEQTEVQEATGRREISDPRRPARWCKVFRHRRAEAMDLTDLSAKGKSGPGPESGPSGGSGRFTR